MINIPREILKMEYIPITYEFEGKTFTHALSFCSGRAAYVWDLHTTPVKDGKAISYRHLGEIFLQEGYKWELWINHTRRPELADWFETVLIGWYC